MIRILRGLAASLQPAVAESTGANDALTLLGGAEDLRSWKGIRQLLDQAEERLGQRELDRVLDRHRPAASLVVERPDWDLTPDQRAERRGLTADLSAHLSHNWAIQRPLIDRWATLLADLTAAGEFSLAVPNAGQLDWESLAVLKSVYRLHAERAPDLILGYDPNAKIPAPDDRGVVWPLDPGYVAGSVMGFQAIAGTETVNLGNDTAAADTSAWSPPPMPESDPETRALASLRASSNLSGEATARLITTLERVFRRFGFTSSLRLGLELLDKSPPLTRQQKATVHGIVGLAAHNRQFRSAGNMVLAKLLEQHFSAALDHEDDPARRCALLYRMTVTIGRRQGNLEAAQHWADRAVEEARTADLPLLKKKHQEAWARNIRAYVLLRQHRAKEAVADCETAYHELEAARTGERDHPNTRDNNWGRELVATQTLVAFNLSAIGNIIDDKERFVRWQQVAHEIEAGYPGVERYEAGPWIAHFRSIYRLDLAFEKALRGLASARDETDAPHEQIYTIEAADLAYRLGKARQAAELFEREKTLRDQFALVDQMMIFDIQRSVAWAREGFHERAHETLRQALADPRYAAVDMQAQILAFLGEIAAWSDNGSAAESWINRAIDLAVESGVRDTLLRVVTAAGRACQQLGRGGDATEAFLQGIELAEAEGDDRANPMDHFAALVGLIEQDGDRPEAVHQALFLIPRALDDPEAWWILHRFLPPLAAQARRDPDLCQAVEMEVLTTAAGQRPDCAAGLAELRAALGEEAVAQA